MTDNTTLKKTAVQVRRSIVESISQAQSGHPGGSLSAADVLTYLYFEKMNIDPENPDWADRDRFILSKGHAAPALYAVLARRGYFDPDQLETLRRQGSILQGHPDMKKVPGIDMSSGSLGQGLSAACGMAYAAKMDGKDWKVYVLLGDGELEEGQVWEAVMFASQKHLDNLVILVDNNDLQIDGHLEEVCSPCPIAEKFEAFGCKTKVADGHNFDALRAAFDEESEGKVKALILKTVKGKGISFMEDQAGWHGKAPDAGQLQQALEELAAQEVLL